MLVYLLVRTTKSGMEINKLWKTVNNVDETRSVENMDGWFEFGVHLSVSTVIGVSEVVQVNGTLLKVVQVSVNFRTALLAHHTFFPSSLVCEGFTFDELYVLNGIPSQ